MKGGQGKWKKVLYIRNRISPNEFDADTNDRRTVQSKFLSSELPHFDSINNELFHSSHTCEKDRKRYVNVIKKVETP